MAEAITLLVLYNLFFWRQHYGNPISKLATGELLSTFFPVWIWQGRQWRNRRLPIRDRIYYQYPGCIPFLSTFYPVHIATSLLSSLLPLGASFVLLSWSLLSHFLLGSVLAYLALAEHFSGPVSLFGAITLAYNGYMIKVQQPCIVYTLAWIPGILVGGWVGAISLAMAALGGYWPILIYFLPVAFYFQPETVLGLLLALPQIIPFCWYWPKSIRNRLAPVKGFGSVPAWRFLDLVIPDLARTSINGVIFSEMTMYSGILGLWLALHLPLSEWTGIMILAMIASMLGSSTFRIPARWLHLFTFSLAMVSVQALENVQLSLPLQWAAVLFQAFDLCRNAGLQPAFPLCELQVPPGRAFSGKVVDHLKRYLGDYRVSGLPYPLFTGYIHEFRTLGYNGGFQLQAMADFRQDTNPNGSGMHAWTADRYTASRYGVKYFYRNRKLEENKDVTLPLRCGILEELECLTRPISNR